MMKKLLILMLCLMFIALPVFAGTDDKVAKTDSEKITKILDKVGKTDITFSFFGTEYQTGDNGTTWLQVLEDYQPVNNATCYLTVYNPDKTKFLDNILMFYLLDSDGIYYYDMILPNVTGIYMASASCYIPARAFADDFLDYSNILSYANVTISDKVFLGNTSSLVAPYAWYHLNNTSGSVVIDSSENGRNGVSVNNPSWVAGKLNNSINLNSTLNQYINFGNTSFNFESTQPVSYEVWFRSSNSNLQMFFDKIILTPVIRGINIYLSSGKIIFAMYTTGSNYIYISTTNSFSNGYWNHLVITYDGSSLASGVKIYVNNILQVVTVTSNNLNGTVINSANFLIGARLDGFQFTGTLDEAVVYTKSLSADEVSFRYNNDIGTESMFIIPGASATEGFIMSKPVILTKTTWFNFLSDYTLNEGNISFSILDATNNTICSGLGNISSCANTTTPIKLYARITRASNISISPEIDNWLVSWLASSIEELRGAGEIHVSSNIAGGSGAKEVWQYFTAMNNAEASSVIPSNVAGVVGVANALDNTCVNTTHILRFGSTNVCYGSDCFDVDVNKTELCQYGCDIKRNECKGDPSSGWLFGGIIIFVIVALLIAGWRYL